MRRLGRVVRLGIPAALIAIAVTGFLPTPVRRAAVGLLFAYWTAIYVRYRRAGLAQTRREWELLRRTSWEAFWRHYNERVPTVEEEYEIWGPYHEHKHEMRYDIVARHARRHLRPGATLLDLGCGSANVADRLADLDLIYIGMDFGEPAVRYSQRKYLDRSGPLTTAFLQADAEHLPFVSGSMDVIVMSEVIEHLLRPELAVWEVSRLLRLGGTFVMTTNNASEVPLRSPLSHLFPWIEKVVGAQLPSVISLRPWAWPYAVSRDLLPEGEPDVYLPHTHHIQAETRRMFAAAGLTTVTWGSFEFPPPQSRFAAWLEKRGDEGIRIARAVEAVAQHTPCVRHLGTHLLMIATKTGEPVAGRPPPGTWPGPLSSDAGASSPIDAGSPAARR